MLLSVAQSSNVGDIFDSLFSLASPPSNLNHKTRTKHDLSLSFHCFLSIPSYHSFPQTLFDCTSQLGFWIPLLSSLMIHSSIQQPEYLFLKQKSYHVILLLKIFHWHPTECKFQTLFIWPLPFSLTSSVLLHFSLYTTNCLIDIMTYILYFII